MAFKYTISELEKTDHEDYLNDFALIQSLINERKHTLTNANAPLSKRLNRLSSKIEDYATGKLNIEDVDPKHKTIKL